MNQVDAIDNYLQAKAAGFTEEEAQLSARKWAEAQELHPNAATKDDLKNSIEKLSIETKTQFEIMMSKISSKFALVFFLGSAMFALTIAPQIHYFLSATNISSLEKRVDALISKMEIIEKVQ